MLPKVRNFGFPLPVTRGYIPGVKRAWNPNTAAWLVAQRGKTKQDTVVEQLAQRGVEISRSWLSRIENGEPFSDELMAAFVELYGSVPPPYEEAGAEEAETDIASALRLQAKAIQAQADAINRLVDRLELAERRPLSQQELQEQTKIDEAVVEAFLREHPEVSTRLLGDTVPAGESR